MIIKVKAKPASSREDILKINENSFEIHLKEKAEDNKANIELIKLLSRYLDVPSSNVEILKGINSRDKIIAIKEENK